MDPPSHFASGLIKPTLIHSLIGLQTAEKNHCHYERLLVFQPMANLIAAG